MEQTLELAVLGLGGSATYALLAVGLVLIYRASGVLNFAHGALAMVGGYVFYELRMVHDWPYLAATLTSMLATAVLGAAVYVLLMRPLKDAAVLVRIIATLGVMIALEAVATLRYGATVLTLPQVLPDEKIEVLGIAIPQDRLWLIAIAAVLTAVLHLISTRTTFGLATRAVAENQRTAAAVGWSPSFIATINWAIGSALAALAGTFIIPIASLSVGPLTLLVVPALAVALVGGFSSFLLAFLGAIVLGMSQGAATQFAGDLPGLAEALPFVLILIVLIVRKQALSARGEVLHRLPSLGTGQMSWPVVGGLFVVGVVASLTLPLEWAVALGVSVIVAIILLSITVITGYAGQLSLGQYALAGFGALVAARTVVDLGWPFEIALVLGVVAAMVAGLLFGIPALRSRGATLAIMTLGLGTAVQGVIFSNGDYAGGPYGFSVSEQTFFGISIDPLTDTRTYTIFALVWFALAVLAVRNLRRHRVGRRLIAIRTNERAAASIGVNVRSAKLYAFVISAGLAGLGGVLLGFSSSSVFLSEGFGSLQSVNAVMLSVVGGVAHISGSVFGGQLANGGLPGGVIANNLGGDSAQQWLALVGAVIVLITLRLNPDGIAGSMARLRHGKGRSAAHGAGADTAKRPGKGRAALGERRATPPIPKPSSTLEISGLNVRFGGVHALREMDLTIRSGEVVGLIGPNGAGKTTFIDGVTGYVRTTGQIKLGGDPVETFPPHRRAQVGITRSFQSLELFDDVTVAENLRAAAEPKDGRGYLTALLPGRPQRLPEVVYTIVEEFQLGPVLDSYPRALSYGQRRLVAIARAMAREPKFLLLDEPAAGLGSIESAELRHLVRRLADEWNIGVLLIEHDVDMVMKVCDRVAVLDFGQKIAEGTPAEVQTNPEVLAAYLGSYQDDDRALEPVAMSERV
jgi:sulfate-transporting ATPase